MKQDMKKNDTKMIQKFRINKFNAAVYFKYDIQVLATESPTLSLSFVLTFPSSLSSSASMPELSV